MRKTLIALGLVAGFAGSANAFQAETPAYKHFCDDLAGKSLEALSHCTDRSIAEMRQSTGELNAELERERQYRAQFPAGCDRDCRLSILQSAHEEAAIAASPEEQKRRAAMRAKQGGPREIPMTGRVVEVPLR